ncbi:MAG TPA: 4Fe-4S dicluster domain-containing protein [Anaeromyxobacteraceae bacterium]|nr:4Fe-4S dicluster domain-containing protein [Anaeromyxobacteraceae bacterium]
MSHALAEKSTKVKLVDTTRCVGCRSCQVSCKQWNNLRAEKTELPRPGLGLQNPATLSSNTFVVVTYHEIPDEKAPGGLRYISSKRQCMHCDEPACASACPVTALQKTSEGAVVYTGSKCLGCRYCMWACPFGVPTAQWDSLAPEIRKCTWCYDRTEQPAPLERNGQKLTDEERRRFQAAQAVPSCVKQCPANALSFGDRDAMLAEARGRIAKHPDKYVNHIYGEKEAGGTATLYLAAVPFEKLGFPNVGFESYPARSVPALSAVPIAVLGVGAALGGTYALHQRRTAVARSEGIRKEVPPPKDHHPEFAPAPSRFWTPTNIVLAALVALAGVSFVLRFALGLGGSTHLSNTWAWGLWIALDVVWIAIAAGAFATAGIIYVFKRDDLYSIGRSAVLMGLLSYSFVAATLVADLGLPWHFYQLALQAPKHSAMFEVAWCVALYVTILLFEFLPVPLERLGLTRWTELWKKWAPVYVVVAVTLFVWLMSRNPIYTGAAFVLFGFMAYAFRPRPGQASVPIMLAIAAVTLSTMHQSSLGSLFLLMPDKLAAAWWSPILPVYFFLSAVAAGLALVILVQMWQAKAYRRELPMKQLASLGKLAFFALLVYEAVRLGDLAFRGRLGAAFIGPKAPLFFAEIVVLGLLPLVMLAFARVRESPTLLGTASFLTLGGVVMNRLNAVLFAMDLKGPLPQNDPSSYFPSFVEWAITIGLVAAAVFLFNLGVRYLPVLPKEETGHGS